MDTFHKLVVDILELILTVICRVSKKKFTRFSRLVGSGINSTCCSRKNATDLNNSNGSCFIHVGKELFLLKSAIIRINFDIFSSIFGDLVVKLKISKLQNCLQVKIRAAALAIVD